MARAAVRLISNTNSAELRRKQANDALGWLDSVSPNEGSALPPTDPDLDGRLFVLNPPGEIYIQEGGAWVLVASPPTPGAIGGLIVSTAGGSATFSVTAGSVTDSTGKFALRLTSAMSKTTGAWAPGPGNGAMDTGTVPASGWIFLHVIRNQTTLATDLLVSLSPTAPTLPAGYTQFALIWAMATSASLLIKFTQIDNRCYWDTPFADVTNIASTTTAALHSLSVPVGINVIACFNFIFGNNSIPVSYVLVSSPRVPDLVTNGVTGNVTVSCQNANNDLLTQQLQVETDTSGRVRTRSNVTTGSIYIATTGFIFPRGRA